MINALAWLASEGGSAFLSPDGEVHILFDQYTPRQDRERIKRITARYSTALQLLQLEVPAGTQPRSVRQLITSGGDQGCRGDGM